MPSNDKEYMRQYMKEYRKAGREKPRPKKEKHVLQDEFHAKARENQKRYYQRKKAGLVTPKVAPIDDDKHRKSREANKRAREKRKALSLSK